MNQNNITTEKQAKVDRIQKAIDYFHQGYNCSQSIACAYSDLFGISPDDAYKIAAGFGGGIGGMRETCGSISGAVIIAGLKEANYAPNDNKSKTMLYKKVQKISDEFSEHFGTNTCSALLTKANATFSDQPSPRTMEYYKIRPCARFVEFTAELVEKHLEIS